MKGKIDRDCQHDSAEDADEGGASRGDDDADDDGGLRDGLCFYFEDQFHLPRKSSEEKI